MKTQKPQLSVIKFSQRISPWSITSGGYLTQTVDFNPYESESPLDTSAITGIEKDGEKYSHYTAPSHDKKVQSLFDIHFRLSTHDQLTVIPLIKPYETVQEDMYHTRFIPHTTPDDVRTFREVLRLKIADLIASTRAIAELTEMSVNVQEVCQAIQTDIEPLLYEQLPINPNKRNYRFFCTDR